MNRISKRNFVSEIYLIRIKLSDLKSSNHGEEYYHLHKELELSQIFTYCLDGGIKYDLPSGTYCVASNKFDSLDNVRKKIEEIIKVVFDKCTYKYVNESKHYSFIVCGPTRMIGVNMEMLEGE